MNEEHASLGYQVKERERVSSAKSASSAHTLKKPGFDT